MNQEDFCNNRSSYPSEIIGYSSVMYRMLGINPFELAIVNGYIDEVRKCIEEVRKCIEIFDKKEWSIDQLLDNEGNTYLMIATKNGHLEIIRYLVSQGANIHSINHEKVTVLMKAVESGKLEIVEYFVSEGVNIQAIDENGETAFMKAVELGYLDIVKYLFSKDANINIVNYKGNALMIAISPLVQIFTDNHLQIVEFLLQKGVKINATIAYEWTPLLSAVSRLNDKVVEMLLKYGANPNHIGIFNLNALSLLKKYYENEYLSDEHKVKYNKIVEFLTVKN